MFGLDCLGARKISLLGCIIMVITFEYCYMNEEVTLPKNGAMLVLIFVLCKSLWSKDAKIDEI